MIKRLLDITISLVGVLTLSPLIIFVIMASRVKLGKPILFYQLRPGLQGRPFEMVKFRTMADIRDVEGNPMPDSERLTVYGRFLRSTSIDELPGLWNVLKGDMSLVGPRPLLMDYLPLYSAEQRRRHDVRPGITGWAQVNGRNAISWEEKFDFDVWYIDHWTLTLDLKILVLTVWKVLQQDGINQEGYTTSEEFMGSHQPPQNP